MTNDNFAPDFKTACDRANEILISSRAIQTFPFSMDSVIEEMSDIAILGYSALAGHGQSPAQIVRSEDGALVERGGHHIMFLNEEMPETRRRFTGAHEGGHHFLRHDMAKLTKYKTAKDRRFEPLYKKYEAETNMFAAQLLMPEQIIIELSKRGCNITKDFLMRTFHVSKQAAEIRMKNIRQVYNWHGRRRNHDALGYDDIIIEKFKAFIDSIAPRKIGYVQDFEREHEMELERQSWI